MTNRIYAADYLKLQRLLSENRSDVLSLPKIRLHLGQVTTAVQATIGNLAVLQKTLAAEKSTIDENTTDVEYPREVEVLEGEIVQLEKKKSLAMERLKAIPAGETSPSVNRDLDYLNSEIISRRDKIASKKNNAEQRLERRKKQSERLATASQETKDLLIYIQNVFSVALESKDNGQILQAVAAFGQNQTLRHTFEQRRTTFPMALPANIDRQKTMVLESMDNIDLRMREICKLAATSRAQRKQDIGDVLNPVFGDDASKNVHLSPVSAANTGRVIVQGIVEDMETVPALNTKEGIAIKDILVDLLTKNKFSASCHEVCQTSNDRAERAICLLNQLAPHFSRLEAFAVSTASLDAFTKELRACMLAVGEREGGPATAQIREHIKPQPDRLSSGTVPSASTGASSDRLAL